LEKAKLFGLVTEETGSVKVFYLPTGAQLSSLKNNFKIHIKIDIKTAVLVSILILILKLFLRLLNCASVGE
jgi:hypothetical protein